MKEEKSDLFNEKVQSNIEKTRKENITIGVAKPTMSKNKLSKEVNKLGSDKTIQNIGLYENSYSTFIYNYLLVTFGMVYLLKDLPLDKFIEIGLNSIYKGIDELVIHNQNSDLMQFLYFNGTKWIFALCAKYSLDISVDCIMKFGNLLKKSRLKGEIYCTESKQILSTIYKNLSFKFIKKNYDDRWNFIPRYYQISAYEAIKKVKRGILWLACGMGKTTIAIMNASDFKLNIIFSPLIVSAEQNLERFKEGLPGYKSILVCSGVGERNNLDKVKSLLGEKLIISCTYDSADIIKIIIDDINKSYGNHEICITVDEFHNLRKEYVLKESDDKVSDFYEVLTQSWKYLFLSATPRVFKLENDDNDIRNILGEIVYSFSFGHAILLKHICDYCVYLPDISIIISNLLKNISETINVSVKLFDEIYAVKSIFILMGMMANKHFKCIAYLSKKDNCEAFKNSLHMVNKYFGLKLKVFTIISDVKSDERRKKLKEFAEYDGYAIICSINILKECIDIVECDSVYFIKKVKDKRNIIQMLSRATRRNPNNLKKEAGVYIWTDSYDGAVTNILSALKEYDSEFNVNKVKIIDYSKKLKECVINRDFKDTKTSDEDKQKYLVLDAIIIGIKRFVSWDEKFGKLVIWLKIHDWQYPKYGSENEEEQMLAEWCKTQRRNKDNMEKNSQYRFNKLDKLKGWSWNLSKKKSWSERYQEYVDWVKINKCHPKRNKNDDYETSLFHRASRQRRFKRDYDNVNKKSKNGIIDEDDIESDIEYESDNEDEEEIFSIEKIDMLNEIKGWFWINEPDEYGIIHKWYKMYYALIEWIHDNTKLSYRGKEIINIPKCYDKVKKKRTLTDEELFENKLFNFLKENRSLFKLYNLKIEIDGIFKNKSYSEKEKSEKIIKIIYDCSSQESQIKIREIQSNDSLDESEKIEKVIELKKLNKQSMVPKKAELLLIVPRFIVDKNVVLEEWFDKCHRVAKWRKEKGFLPREIRIKNAKLYDDDTLIQLKLEKKTELNITDEELELHSWYKERKREKIDDFTEEQLDALNEIIDWNK